MTLDRPAQVDTTVLIESSDSTKATVTNAVASTGATTGTFGIIALSTAEVVTVWATLGTTQVTDTFAVVRPGG